MRRGDTTSNIILFLLVIIAAVILVTWYVNAIKPVRYVIGAVSEDAAEIGQHLANACSATIYRATYVVQSQAMLSINETHYCIYAETFGQCDPVPCSVTPARLSIVPGSLLNITRDGEISLRT